MKKLIFIFAMMLCVVSAIGQTLPAGATSTGVMFKAPSAQYPAAGLQDGEIYEIWTYNGDYYYVCKVCKPNVPNPTAPTAPSASADLSNTNTVNAYNDQIELMKAEAMLLEAKAKQAQVDAEIAYNQRMADIAQADLDRQKKADKVTKRQGGANVGANYLDATGHVLSGVGLVLLGDAGEKGKLGTKIIQNFFGSTLTDVEPTGPLMGSTTNTSTNTNPVVINGNPITGSTTISNTDPRWNPLLGNTNTNRRVIIN